MKTYSKNTAAVLTDGEIAQLSTVNLDTLKPSQRRRLNARARATITACNRFIRYAAKRQARNEGRPESRAWTTLGDLLTTQVGEQIGGR